MVKDKKLRKLIRAAAWNQAQVTTASLLIVLCMDLKSWKKEPEWYWQNTIDENRNRLVNRIQQYDKDKENVQRAEALRSCGLASQTIMLSAKSMGYDSCPLDGFDFEAVKPIGGQIPYNEVVIKNKF